MKQTRMFSLVALLALLCIPGLSRAQQTLTVYDGTATSSYVPVYGFYCDAYLKCEFVIPASELTDMIGSTISQMDFYASSPAEEAWTGSFQVFLKEVEADTLNAYSGTTDATIVYTGTLDGTGSIMTVEFDNDYLYNGGNLLVGIYLTTTGNYKSVTFSGQTISYNCCMQGYSYTSLDGVEANQRNFIPKTTFTYSGGGSTPDGVVIGDPTSASTSYKVPVNNLYNYSLTETIITASEIGGAMNIGSISYKYASTSPMLDTTCGIKIWLKPTTKTQFSSSADLDSVDNTATLVYDGPFSCSAGWNEITFTTPYAYNGSDNLMVIVCDTASGFDGGSYYSFNTSSCANEMSLCWYSDTHIPDPTSTSYQGSKYIYDYRPLMVLGEAPVPLAVTISGPTTGVGNNSLTFTAAGPSDADYSWYADDYFQIYNNDQTVQFIWLVAGTYKVRVTATRGTERVSDSLMVTINRRTPETTINSTAQWYAAAPYSDGDHAGSFIKFSMQQPEQAQDISTNNFDQAFAAEYANGNVYVYDRNEGKFYSQPFDETNPVIGNLTIIGAVSNQIMDMSYNIVDNTMYGIIVNGSDRQLVTIDLATGALTNIGDVMSTTMQTFAIDATGHAYSIATDGNLYSVNLSDGSFAEIGSTGLDVNYVQSMNFDRATGELFWAQLNSLNDFGLYKVNTTTGHADFVGYFGNHAIEICGLFNTSMLTPNGVDISAPATPISIYPNPTTDIVNVSAEGLREVNLLDLNGRVLSTTSSPRVDVSGFAAGVYFLRVVTDNGIAREKLVKE